MWTRDKVYEFVNIVGSVASITGFAVLIVGSFSPASTRDPEDILWQYIGFAVGLLVSATIFVVVFNWIVDGFIKYPPNTGKGAVVICLKVCLGLVLLGISGDGMISAIRWTVWPRLPVSFVQFWFSRLVY